MQKLTKVLILLHRSLLGYKKCKSVSISQVALQKKMGSFALLQEWMHFKVNQSATAAAPVFEPGQKSC